jgi:hypothetical protein
MLEQWIPRLGYTTTRAEGQAACDGDAVLVVCPTRPADEAFRRRLVEFVEGGGRLLVLDGPNNPKSTADGLLQPFGLSFIRSEPRGGTLSLTDGWPDIAVDRAWEVAGGEPIARLDKRPVGAVASYGKGRVMALGFAGLFDDASMGHDWMNPPDGEVLLRYKTLYALLRSWMDGRPPTATEEPAAQPPKPSEAKPPALKPSREARPGTKPRAKGWLPPWPAGGL